MKLAIFSVLALLASAPGFASSKNLVLCGWNDNDDSLAIREDAGGQLVALLSMVDHGTVAFKVEQLPVEPGRMGAGRDYEGHGFSLHINTDGAPTSGGFHSVASIPSMSLRGEVFSCRIVE